MKFCVFQSGETLWKACDKGYICTVRCEIAAGTDVNYKHHIWNSTPLHAAVQKEHYGIIKTLIDAGASLTTSSSMCGLTPLSTAQTKDTINLILDSIPDVKDFSVNNVPILHHAAEYGCGMLVSSLLARGVDVNMKNSEGYTAQEVAEQTGRKFIAQVIRGEQKVNKVS